MKAVKTVKTNISEVSLLENGLIYIKYTVTIFNDIEALREERLFLEKEFNLDHKFYVIINTKQIKKVTQEVRNFAATREILQNTNALTIIVGNGLSRIAGNLYLKFSKPSIPTKLFTNFEKAQEWLLEERIKVEHSK